jgi:hypothetical protein
MKRLLIASALVLVSVLAANSEGLTVKDGAIIFKDTTAMKRADVLYQAGVRDDTLF